ncbi:hypothetical protein ACIRS1_24810 [Kitasatospora sp. NPDC101176]|uniref:hypothetical protein n=1 Tax=Kitasatospora sp. NPDC101176 TaxID=3364099 RepID=UPI00381DB4A2
MIDGDGEVTAPPPGLVEAGERLCTALERHLADPDGPGVEADVERALEELDLAVSRRPRHTAPEEWRARYLRVRDVSCSIRHEYGLGATPADLRTALARLDSP